VRAPADRLRSLVEAVDDVREAGRIADLETVEGEELSVEVTLAD
jgi:hypothetical protein